MRFRFALQLSERRLYLRAAPLLFIRSNDLVALFEIFLAPHVKVDGELLIVFRHLFSEIAAARMDHKIQCAVRGAVDLDEMIPAAERAERALQTSCVLQTSITAKRRQIEMLHAPLPDVHARGDEMRRLIDRRKIHIRLRKLHREHAAADVHADDVGAGAIADRHRRADRAALSRVHVRHDAHAAAARQFVIAHAADLLDRFVLDRRGVADGGRNVSFYFKHINILQSKSRCGRIPSSPAPCIHAVIFR